MTLYALRRGGERRLLGSFDVGPEPAVHEMDVSLQPNEQIMPDASRLFRSRPTFTGSPDAPNPIGIALAKTAGVKLIGKQVGDYSRLIKETGLAPAAQACIEGIKNVPGEHAQFRAALAGRQAIGIEPIGPYRAWRLQHAKAISRQRQADGRPVVVSQAHFS